MQKFSVMVFERKRDTSGGRMVAHQGRQVPEHSIPKKLPSLSVTVSDADTAKRAASEHLERQGYQVAGVSFSAEAPGCLVAYVFEKG